MYNVQRSVQSCSLARCSIHNSLYGEGDRMDIERLSLKDRFLQCTRCKVLAQATIGIMVGHIFVGVSFEGGTMADKQVKQSRTEGSLARQETLRLATRYHHIVHDRLVASSASFLSVAQSKPVGEALEPVAIDRVSEDIKAAPGALFLEEQNLPYEYEAGTPLLIFGYASVVWKPDLPFDRKWWGYVTGWKRRFWQGSPDHRGTPRRPGRVATLLRAENVDALESRFWTRESSSGDDVKTWGIVYSIDSSSAAEVLEKMDFREKEGFMKILLPIQCEDGTERLALVYSATEANESFLGPSSVSEMAWHMYSSVGPSGENKEYLTKLYEALGSERLDEHIVKMMEAYTFLEKSCEPLSKDFGSILNAQKFTEEYGEKGNRSLVVFGREVALTSIDWPNLYYTVEGGPEVHVNIQFHLMHWTRAILVRKRA